MRAYPFQKRVAKALRQGQNVILQAPTGAGKTRAALYPFLEVWDRETPAEFPHKCIYSVPVRVLTTQFEAAYKGIATQLGVHRPMEVKVQTGERPDDPQFAEADLIFTTIDQTLSSILGVPYSVSPGKANINAGAVIASYLVFDEFHLFPPKGALMTTLQILRLLKATTPFVLMTATFSRAMLDELERLLEAKIITVSEDELGTIETRWGEFPRRKRRFHVVDDTLTPEVVLAHHEQRTIAICNTVKRAQDLYRGLLEAVGPKHLILLHSRFLKADRDAKEERVRLEFGKDKIAWSLEPLILVATQVIEVGLDITCEAMHTEVAPAASVIQRAGRCARFPGEEGDVYIYQVPKREDGEPNFAPYVSEIENEKKICELTWRAFKRCNGQVLDFPAEQSIINETHTEADKKLLEEMAEEEGHIWGLIEDAREGETSARRKLIRKVDNRTLIVHDDPKALGNPYRAEGFSLWQGSLYGRWRELEERRKELGLDWALKYPVPSKEEEESRAPVCYQWRPVREKEDLNESLLFAIHPLLVAYDKRVGFRFVESGGGGYRTGPSEWKGQGKERYTYRLESYPAHIAGMMQVYKRDSAEEMAYVIRRLAKHLRVKVNMLEKAVRLALALHDVGKLQDGWQKWARAYQEAIGEPLTDEEFMAAHTHWDPFDEEHEAVRKQTNRKVKRPHHAGEGAMAAARIVWEALNGRQHEGLYRAVLTAIARHHSPQVDQAAPFKLHRAAQGSVAEALREIGEEGRAERLIEQADAPLLAKRLLKVHDHPWDWWLLYFLIVRALRLADQRSQEEAMYQKEYYMDKRTGTFADVLAAYGLAAVLDEILLKAQGPEAERRIRLRDAGPYYTVELLKPLRREWVENCPYFVGPAYYVKTGSTKPEDIPKGCAVRDVDEEWESFQTYRAQREKLRGEGITGSDLERQLEDSRLSYDWTVVTTIGNHRMQALSTYNRILTQWDLTRDHFTTNLKTILKMCASPGADLEAIAREWDEAVKAEGVERELTAIQLLNPHQGKGQNRPMPKTDYKLNMVNLKSFWLLEYLKATGLWLCATLRVVRGENDRKTYVLAPLNITLGDHTRVFKAFSNRLWNETAIKMDIVAALLYTQCLLEYSEAGRMDELDFEGYGPEGVVAGFHAAHYKLLSQHAYTVMNLAFVGLPRWTGEVKTRAEVLRMKEVIDEHLRVSRNVDENRSDGYNLLLRYRDFLSGGRWDAFFDFAVGYSQYLTSEWEAKNYHIRPFSTHLLGRLIMNAKKELKAIVENPGFQNVAYAIRHSTIIPQGRKARGQDYLYDIRYGLGRMLKQKAHHRNEFIAVLGDFMQSYNAENAQKLELKQKQMRKDLRTSDIEAIVELVDEYGPEVVCNLLVAFGYAREPREEE